MGNIDVDSQLIGSLAEVYYKEYSDQTGNWMFTSLDNIQKNIDSKIIEFKGGFDRVKIRIPDEMISELKEISTPSMIEGSPSYVFDFLACNVPPNEDISGILTKTVDDFSWIEVKSSGSSVSQNQQKAFDKVKIKFTLVVVNNVHDTPYDVTVDFYYDEIPDEMIR